MVVGRFTRALAPLLLAAAPLFVVSPAAAEGEPEPVRVSYAAAPSECPSENVFMERVRTRTEKARFAWPGELARAFAVTVRQTEGDSRFLGHLEFVDAGGRHAERTLRGANCDELVSSLALITALAIDDRIAEAPPDEASPPPSPLHAAPGAPTQEKTSPELQAPPRLPEPAGRIAPHPRRLRWELGGNAGVQSWVTRSVAPAFGGYVELGSSAPSWSLRLSGFHSQRTRSIGTSSADFAADWARLEGCPIAQPLGASFSLSPCLAFDLGQFRARPVRSPALTEFHDTNMAWAAGAVLVRLSWVYRQRLVLGWDGELGVPFTGRDFQLQNADASTSSLLKVPNFGFAAKFGVGLRFP